jgi:hypothetical protein
VYEAVGQCVVDVVAEDAGDSCVGPDILVDCGPAASNSMACCDRRGTSSILAAA